MFGAFLDSDERNPEVQARRFNRIASRYDLVNVIASLGMSRIWTNALVDAVVESVQGREAEAVAGGQAYAPLAGMTILDVACGTGTSSRALANLGADVIGCDVSEGMVAEARRRESVLRQRAAWGSGERGTVRYAIADAADLGFADGRFDAVTCCYGLRNMPSPVNALREMRRVARQDAPVVTLDFDMPRGVLLSWGYRLYNALALPVVGGFFTGHPSDYRYLADSIEQWPGRRGVAHMMRVAGLRHPQCRPLTKGIASLNRAWK